MKLSKKIIAGALAALMAISMMPLTALADEAVDITKLSTPSFTATPKHMDANAESNYYSNVVYYDGTSWSGQGNGNNTYNGVGRMDFKIATPLNTVMVYDGANEVSYHVVLEQHRNQSSGDTQLIHYVGSYDNGFGLYQDWAGGSTDYTQWPSGDDTFAYYDSNNYNESNNLNNGDNHFYKNKMIYSGSVNTDSYYTVVTNQGFYAKTSYKENTWGASRQYKYGDITSYSNQYVINYKPIYDILSNARAIATEINTNGWKYTDASLSQAVSALNAVGNCNPNNYNYSSNVAGTVQQCATDIKNAKAAYDAINLVKKTFTVDFKTSDGSSTIDSRSITAGDALGTLPANSAVASTDGTHHNVYTWIGVSADTVVQADTTYPETATATACNFTAGTHTDATEALNGYTTYNCACGNSYNSYDAQNFDAYDAAIEEYNSLKDDEFYTAASRAAYTSAVEAAIIDKTDETLSPTAIANATAAIIAAQSELVAEATPENNYSLTLTDSVDVNFFIDEDYYEEKGGTKITYSYLTTTDDKSAERTEYSADFADLGANGQLTISAAPAQIAEKCIINVYNDSDVLVDTIEASIEDYCKAIINGEFDQKDKDVAQALLDYGALANEYFGYADVTDTENYTVAHSDDYKAAVDAENFKAKAKASMVAGVDRSGAAVNITGISYVALLDPELRFYVNQTNDVWCYYTDLSISDPSLTAEWIKTDKGNCVRVTGLKASDFAKTFTLTIGTTEVTYNGYAYLYTVLREGSTVDNNLKELAKGIYRYAAACEAKFA